MESLKIKFDKDKTSIIKGVGILFMIFLHVFGGSGWYDNRYDIPLNRNELLIHFMGSLQICVGIFVFMIGYGYSFAKSKDWKYSIKHIKRLLVVYWCILFCLALPVCIDRISWGG
jgi:UDP-N-acetylmuramyl pentapeptide phosphotransferase/UDP-N-acetylglucosamine-1-phosphate transferase